jgi:[ribosomal protein S5]-alanine N-acetyltransferase
MKKIKKVNLRKLRISDLDSVCEMFIDDRVISGIGSDKKAKDFKKKDEITYLKNSIKEYNKKKPKNYNLGIEVNDELVGIIGVNKADWNDNNCEIGYWVGVNYWGRGYGTQAIKLFTQLVIKKFGFIRVYGQIFKYNLASQRAILKAGFKEEGIARKSKKIKNKYLDQIIYSYIK